MGQSSSTKQPDQSLLAPLWGCGWGAALGMWLVAPDVILVHHIRPESAFQWVAILTVLMLVFAAIGAFLAFFGGFVLALLEKLLFGTFADRMWAYALFTGIAVVAGYAIENAVIFYATFRTFDNLSFFSNEIVSILLFLAGLSAALVAAYIVITRSPRRPTPSALALLLSAAGITGASAAVPRSADRTQTVPDIGALATRGTPSSSVPLLFVGIDGATWRVLQPAIDNGSAPTFRAIIEHGVSGDVGALWPPFWSGAAWASIVTGLPRETTGVYEDLGAISPGLPPFQVTLLSSFKLNLMYTVRSYLQEVGLVRLVPPPRALLKAKPVWQLLHESGVNSAVIRFRFTYPPDEQADIVVSDWIGHDGWDNLGVKHSTTPDTVWPPTMASQLLIPFQRDTADPDLFVRLFPGPLPDKPADAVLDPFAALRVSADVDERTFQASRIVLEHNPRQPFMAVYIGGLDSAEHGFWQYRFPEDYSSNPPAAEDVKRFSPVIERYVSFIDERLKDLLALYQQEPNIVIVSDHGYGASPIPDVWRGWHTKDGVFLAAGPSVPKVKERLAVSYYDVVPTLVSLKGFDKPRPLRGKPLFELTGQTTARAAKSY